MIVVTELGGAVTKYDADCTRVDERGHLLVQRMLRIGNYRCPLRLETVATYAPGSWVSTTNKEHGT
jgi:hypothetical protein